MRTIKMTTFNNISDIQINEQDSMIHNSGVRDIIYS